LKEVMGIGTSLSGSLMLYDALETEFRKISLKRDSDCPLCGDNPTISDLSSHAAA
jgi:adenylyltransferase/sulfurtransferase